MILLDIIKMSVTICGKEYNIETTIDLDLSQSNLNEIPENVFKLINLQRLLMYGNQITTLPPEISKLIHLQELSVAHNDIQMLPLEIVTLNNLNIFRYHYNPIENLTNPVITRFLQQFKYGIKGDYDTNFYTDTQNVHSSSIQTSVKDSIFNLLKELTEYKYNYLIDDILTEQCKSALTEYCSDNSVHSVLQCTFEEVMNSVFIEISKMDVEMQKQVKQRINEEMADALCMCFTGRLSRLVNSLSGYSDKVNIKISDSEEIGNIISIMKKKGGDVRGNVERELIERGYERTVIDEWLSYVD